MKNINTILGIETSCDETSAAVIQFHQKKPKVLANVVSSQVELHSRYGGVVPELASRAHLQKMLPVLEEALDRAGLELSEIDGIAVTYAPGLMGSLLVGLQMAKSLAFVADKPLIGINHLEGHLEAIFLEEGDKDLFPNISLLVSGGHTSIYRGDGHCDYTLLGATRDDAAGEAFDKAAKMMGLPYPGGIYIDRLAKKGNKDRFQFPRPMAQKGLDFSFSGLKTACRTLIQKLPKPLSEQDKADISASFQEAIAQILWLKVERALNETSIKNLIVTGGVAANSRLRSLFRENCEKNSINLYIPSVKFCTDNAAMIAMAGYYRFARGESSDFSLNALSKLPRESRRYGRTPKTTPKNDEW